MSVVIELLKVKEKGGLQGTELAQVYEVHTGF